MPEPLARPFALAALAALSLATAQAAVPVNQTAWLTALYSNTNGPGWTNRTNWLTGDPCDNAWYGVTCNAGATSVTALNLSFNNVQGLLPATPNWATVFPDMEQINLISNGLTGPVPALSGFNKLTALYLTSNPGLTGSLPDPSGLPELVSYYAVGTGFTGPIPALTALPKLKAFYVGNNQLTGAAPALGGMPVLEEFNVAGNQLSGPAPAAPGTLTAGNSRLCGNHLDAVADAAWDTAVGFAPWYTNCTYAITPSAGANGSIAPGFGVTPTVAVNAQPSYIATPDADYLLDAFGGTCTGTAAGNTFTISPAVRNCTVTASFRRDPAAPQFTVTASAAANGNIAPAGATPVYRNDSLTLTLTPAPGYMADQVTGTCGGTLNGNTFTTAAVTQNCTVIAAFTRDPAAPQPPAPGPITAVPTLGEWALALLALLMGACGIAGRGHAHARR